VNILRALEANASLTLTSFDSNGAVANANSPISLSADVIKALTKSLDNTTVNVGANAIGVGKTVHMVLGGTIGLTGIKNKSVSAEKGISINIDTVQEKGLSKNASASISLVSSVVVHQIDSIGTRTVDTGKADIAEIIGGIGGELFKFIHIGANNSGLSGENTQLLEEFTDSGLTPIEATISKTDDQIINLHARFTATADKVVKEMGIFSGIGGSTMLSRTTLKGIDMESGDSFTVNYKISLQ
jgi:hypothetical protein